MLQVVLPVMTMMKIEVTVEKRRGKFRGRGGRSHNRDVKKAQKKNLPNSSSSNSDSEYEEKGNYDRETSNQGSEIPLDDKYPLMILVDQSHGVAHEEDQGYVLSIEGADFISHLRSYRSDPSRVLRCSWVRVARPRKVTIDESSVPTTDIVSYLSLEGH